MKILFWIVSLCLVGLEAAFGIGKVIGVKSAIDWMNRLSLTKPIMSVFGGLEVGAIGIILFSLFYKGSFNDKIVPWACLVLVILKVVDLILHLKTREPFPHVIDPIIVITLTAAFYFLRKRL